MHLVFPFGTEYCTWVSCFRCAHFDYSEGERREPCITPAVLPGPVLSANEGARLTTERNDMSEAMGLSGASEAGAVWPLDRALAAVAVARIVPVVSLASVEQAEPLADALIAGGITAVEITLRTPSGVGAIARLADYSALLTVGAGTVVSVAQVDEVIDAGARFVISPGIDEAVVTRCLARGVLPVPGVGTASEVQLADRLGLSAVKVFPAAELGGAGFVRAMRGPFPHMRFLPSGGVTADNVAAYLATPGVFAVSGSWMAPDAAIAAGDWERVAQLAAAATAAIAAPPGE